MDVQNADGSTAASNLLAQVSAAGILTSVDLVSDKSDRFAAVVKASLPHIDYLFCNEIELGQLAGFALESLDTPKGFEDLEKALQYVLLIGAKKGIFCHFHQGCIYAHADGSRYLQASVRVPSSMVLGSAGAGDAFAAGVLFGLHAEEDISTCLQMGVCSAASSLLSSTCSMSVMPMTQALAWGQTLGFNTLAN
jgi:sugar/nucleoside kinase (ribokinase family)